MSKIRYVSVDSVTVGDRWRRRATLIRPPADDMPPLILTREGRLISGWRRLQAAREYQAGTVPIITATCIMDVIPPFQEEARNAVPMVFSDLMRLMDVLEDMERPQIDLRRLQRLRANISGGTPPNPGPRLREMLGAIGGWSGSTTGRARPLWLILRDGDHPDADLIAALDDGKVAITTAYNQVFYDGPPAREVAARPARTTRGQFTAAPLRRPGPPTAEEVVALKKQATIIANIANGLSGYTIALRDLDGRAVQQVPEDALTGIIADFAAFQRAIRPILDALKERQ